VPPARGRVLLATLARSLDRATDVAAALEVRGYARARPAAAARRPWSRHDARLASVAIVLVAAAIAGKLAGIGGFDPYPSLSLAHGPAELGLAILAVAGGGLPFAGARARLGVAGA
jgi:energy-coupling factor transport system permease protein